MDINFAEIPVQLTDLLPGLVIAGPLLAAAICLAVRNVRLKSQYSEPAIIESYKAKLRRPVPPMQPWSLKARLLVMNGFVSALIVIVLFIPNSFLKKDASPGGTETTILIRTGQVVSTRNFGPSVGLPGDMVKVLICMALPFVGLAGSIMIYHSKIGDKRRLWLQESACILRAAGCPEVIVNEVIGLVVREGSKERCVQ